MLAPSLRLHTLPAPRVLESRLSRTRLLVNYGVTQLPSILTSRQSLRVLNPAAAVAVASSKKDTLLTLAAHEESVTIPEWCESLGEDRGSKIYLARTLLRASGGRGIVVVRPGDPVPKAPLYVRYIRKQAEYRVHVLGGRAAVTQQKRRRNGAEQNTDEQLIRNYDNGWVFATQDVRFHSPEIEESVKQQSVAAVAKLGLDFGAVDICVNLEGTKAYVLEVNTAPGLSSPTVLAAYGQYLREVSREYR